MFVSEAIEGRAGGVVGGRLNDQDGAPPAVIIQLPATADDAFAVLPQHLRIAVGVLVIQRVRHHLSESVYATRSKPLSPSGNRTASPEKCQPSIDLNGCAVRGIRGSVRNNLARSTGTPGAGECCNTACTSP